MFLSIHKRILICLQWEKLVAKAERLVTFGDEPKEWYALLRPVLVRFVSTFDYPTSVDITNFWRKIAHYGFEGSGSQNLCVGLIPVIILNKTYKFQGWLTAFCFFNEQGAKIYRSGRDSTILELDGTEYRNFNVSEVPSGWFSVPVKIDINGSEMYTTMVSGSVGIKVTSSGKDLHEKPGQTGLDTVSPVVGYWLFESEKEKQSDDES